MESRRSPVLVEIPLRHNTCDLMLGRSVGASESTCVIGFTNLVLHVLPEVRLQETAHVRRT